MRGRRPPRTIAGAGAALAALGLWFALAPAAVGGASSYLVARGASMQPSLEDGDLIVVRRAARYAPGQVIAFRDPGLRRVVVHRIVARRGDRFVTRGDNNPFRDPYRPRPGDVLGRQVVSVPRAGAILAWADSPPRAALLVGGAALLPAGGRRRRRRRGSGGPSTSGPAAAAAPALLLAGCSLAALAAVALARPATEIVTVPGAYRQTGSFSYEAPARAGATHRDGAADTGEAIYPRLSRELRVRFAYRLDADRPARARGSLGLDAVVSDGAGWSRTWSLDPDRAVAGSGASAEGVVSLPRLRALVARFERETGAGAASYTLRIVPRVRVAAEIGGAAVAVPRFAPELELRMDDVRLVPAALAAGAAPSFTRSQASGLPRPMPATIGPGRLALPVERARIALGAGALLAFGLAAGLGRSSLTGLRTSERRRIEARYGRRLLAVGHLPEPPGGRAVTVSRMTDLARLADRAQSPILVAGSGERAGYGVLDGEILYRYDASPVPAAAP